MPQNKYVIDFSVENLTALLSDSKVLLGPEKDTEGPILEVVLDPMIESGSKFAQDYLYTHPLFGTARKVQPAKKVKKKIKKKLKK